MTWWEQVKSAFYLVFLSWTMKFFGSVEGALVELHARENGGMDVVRFTYRWPGQIALNAGRRIRLRAFNMLTAQRVNPSANFTVRDLKLAFATQLSAWEFNQVRSGIIWLLQMDEGCAWTELGLAMRTIANIMGKDGRWESAILEADERNALDHPQVEVRRAAISLALSRISREIWIEVTSMVTDVDRAVRIAALEYLSAAFKLESPPSPRHVWGREFVNALTLAALDQKDPEFAILARRALAEAEVCWDEVSDDLLIVLLRARIFMQNCHPSLLAPLAEIGDERLVAVICKDHVLRKQALTKLRLDLSESPRWHDLMESAYKRLTADGSAGAAAREDANAGQ